MEPTEGPHKHAHPHRDCPACLVPQKWTRGAKFAWTIAGVALVLLAIVFFAGIGSPGATWAGLGGVTILALVACPLMMGLMMWMMTRMDRRH